MAGIIQNLLQDVATGFFGNDYLRDYTHASKTFRADAYKNAPKYKFLFHVYFDINPEAYVTRDNFGLAVKTAKLPSFQIKTHEMNQYNRKRIVQTKLTYNPVEISFHDDNGNMIQRLWKEYYAYHYSDTTRPGVTLGGRNINPGAGPANSFNSRTIYDASIQGDENWGLTAEPSSGLTKVPFFKTINIFGFNQHNFTSYILVNPMITHFGHDTYSYSESSGIMENTMTLDYETVVYETGAIDGRTPESIIRGFATNENYDHTVSPISVPGANGTIIGNAGLLDAAGGVLDSLARGDILGAARTVGVTRNTFKNTNLKQILKADLVGGISSAISNTPNRSTPFKFPAGQTSPNQSVARVVSSPPKSD